MVVYRLLSHLEKNSAITYDICISTKTVELFDRGPKTVKLWSCLKEDLVTELTESLANYIFPGMIDTTTDSVQQVASKLNGAQVISPVTPTNMTDIVHVEDDDDDNLSIKPINQSASISTSDLPISASLSLPSLIVANKPSAGSSSISSPTSKAPSTLASLLFPDVALTTSQPFKNSTSVITSIPLPSSGSSSSSPIAPLNVSVTATPVDNMEYDNPGELPSPTNESSKDLTNTTEPSTETIILPPVINPPQEDGDSEDKATATLPLTTPSQVEENKPNITSTTSSTKVSKGPVVIDERRPMAISIQPEPEEGEDDVEMKEGSAAPLYSGTIVINDNDTSLNHMVFVITWFL